VGGDSPRRGSWIPRHDRRPFRRDARARKTASERGVCGAPALDGDRQAALDAFDSDRQINGLGLDTRADTVEHLNDLFQSNGISPIAWYGVRLFTDGWTGAPIAEEAEPTALRVELEASLRDPYRQMSRLFHLLGLRDP